MSKKFTCLRSEYRVIVGGKRRVFEDYLQASGYAARSRGIIQSVDVMSDGSFVIFPWNPNKQEFETNGTVVFG